MTCPMRGKSVAGMGAAIGGIAGGALYVFKYFSQFRWI